jgi:hypothetical protein
MLVCVDMGWYLLAPQSVQSALPVASLYLPATQAVHVPPFGPVNPRLHTHCDSTLLPVCSVTALVGQLEHVLSVFAVAVEYVCDGQSEHAADPWTVLNFPGGHATHGPPLDPVNPGLHTQSFFSSLPGGAIEFSGHCSHMSLVAPTKVEYQSAGQIEHAAGPVATLNVPATHKVHAVVPPPPVLPALHVQSTGLSLAAGALVFAGQSVQSPPTEPSTVEYLFSAHDRQAEEPVTDLNLPRTHASHQTPSAPVYPALHVQSTAASWPPPTVFELDGQA